MKRRYGRENKKDTKEDFQKCKQKTRNINLIYRHETTQSIINIKYRRKTLKYSKNRNKIDKDKKKNN